MDINLSVEKIIDALGVEKAACSLDRSFVVRRISSLEKAGPDDLAVVLDRGDLSVFDSVSTKDIQLSSAGLLLVEKPLVVGKNYLIVPDALAAYQKIVAWIDNLDHKKKIYSDLHENAFVSVDAKLDQNVSVEAAVVVQQGSQIGSNSFIGSQTFIGKNCTIGSNVVIYPGVKILDRTVIGDGSIIHSGTVIGSDGFGYVVTKKGLRKIPQIGIVRIGRNVEIGANCSVDRASYDETVIEDCVKIDNSVHVAHNVRIGQGTAILAQTGIAGSVVVGKGCQIGGQVAIRDHVCIGDGVKIVSKSGVMNNIKAGQVVCGTPTIPFSQWKRMTVVMLRLPDIFKKFNSFLNNQSARPKRSFWQKLFFK